MDAMFLCCVSSSHHQEMLSSSLPYIDLDEHVQSAPRTSASTIESIEVLEFALGSPVPKPLVLA